MKRLNKGVLVNHLWVFVKTSLLPWFIYDFNYVRLSPNAGPNCYLDSIAN